MVTLTGNNIYLRALEPEDLDYIHKIENNETFWELSATQTPYSRAIIKDYIENSHRDIYEVKQLRLLISRKDHKSVGCIDLFDFNPLHRRAGVGILVTEEEDRKAGYGKEALTLLISYCKKHLNLHQLFANILSDNVSSISLFEKSGFQRTGVKKDWIFSGGVYKDELLYQIIL